MSVNLYAFSSFPGMWIRLVTTPIDDRESMEGGGEGTSAKEVNGGSNWFSKADMMVGGGGAFCL